MSRSNIEIRTIVWSLALLYAVSFTIYTEYYRFAELRWHATVLMACFGILLMGSIAVAKMIEWGRWVMVIVNAFLILYIIVLSFELDNMVPITYAILSFIVILFFIQPKIVARFRATIIKGKQGKWTCILVIDNDGTSVELIRTSLIERGYAVLVTNTGEEGLRVATTQKPDLILLEVMLPGIKGREVCRRLKENAETEHIPVVFMTAKESQDDINAEMAVGGVGHLTKPVNLKLLLDTIKKLSSSSSR